MQSETINRLRKLLSEDHIVSYTYEALLGSFTVRYSDGTGEILRPDETCIELPPFALPDLPVKHFVTLVYDRNENLTDVQGHLLPDLEEPEDLT
jgi:hypothetical protein